MFYSVIYLQRENILNAPLSRCKTEPQSSYEYLLTYPGSNPRHLASVTMLLPTGHYLQSEIKVNFLVSVGRPGQVSEFPCALILKKFCQNLVEMRS